MYFPVREWKKITELTMLVGQDGEYIFCRVVCVWSLISSQKLPISLLFSGLYLIFILSPMSVGHFPICNPWTRAVKFTGSPRKGT